MKHVPLWLLQTHYFIGLILQSKRTYRRIQMQMMTHKTNACVVLTVVQAATYLGLAVSTLNKWRCHGGGPVFIKLGRAVRYRQEDLDQFVMDGRATMTSDPSVY